MIAARMSALPSLPAAEQELIADAFGPQPVGVPLSDKALESALLILAKTLRTSLRAAGTKSSGSPAQNASRGATSGLISVIPSPPAKVNPKTQAKGQLRQERRQRWDAGAADSRPWRPNDSTNDNYSAAREKKATREEIALVRGFLKSWKRGASSSDATAPTPASASELGELFNLLVDYAHSTEHARHGGGYYPFRHRPRRNRAPPSSPRSLLGAGGRLRTASPTKAMRSLLFGGGRNGGIMRSGESRFNRVAGWLGGESDVEEELLLAQTSAMISSLEQGDSLGGDEKLGAEDRMRRKKSIAGGRGGAISGATKVPSRSPSPVLSAALVVEDRGRSPLAEATGGGAGVADGGDGSSNGSPRTLRTPLDSPKAMPEGSPRSLLTVESVSPSPDNLPWAPIDPGGRTSPSSSRGGKSPRSPDRSPGGKSRVSPDPDGSLSHSSSSTASLKRPERRLSLSQRAPDSGVSVSKLDTDGGCVLPWLATISFPGAEEERGVKPNQDYGYSIPTFLSPGNGALFGVFDGHGASGHKISHEAAASIVVELEGLGADGSLQADPPAAMIHAFERTNKHLELHSDAAERLRRDPNHEGAHGLPVSEDPSVCDATQSGTCGLVVYAKADPGTETVKLWVAGVGDSRAVLGTRGRTPDGELHAVALSTDHKCDLPSEKARIEAAGGYVSEASADGDEFRPSRVYRSQFEPWRGPGLCIARVLGDFDGAVETGLIARPDVYEHTVAPCDEFLLLASDGVWEFIDNDDAVDMVDTFYCKNLDPSLRGTATGDRTPASKACAYLVAKSALAWRTNEGSYRDDITLIVIWLPDLVEKLLADAR